MSFTERLAKAATWDGKDVLLSAGDNLFLNVRRKSKTWIIRRRQGGRLRVTTLGTYPTMTVKQARAETLRLALAAVPSNVTVRDLAEDYYSDVAAAEHRRPELVRGYLDRAVLPELGARRAAEVTPAEVARVIREYRARGARTADQLRSVMKALFTYAVELGVRPDNPAALLTRRVAAYTPVARARVLSDDELRRLWAEVHPNARVLRFQLLTGLRIGEAQKGHRQGDGWHVPAALSKNGKPHTVYLTASALAQLPLPRCTPTAVQSWVKRWCARQGIEPPFVPHDCRRTAATRMAAVGVEPFIVERALNHTLQGVMGVYNVADYADERRAAVIALEAALLAVVRDD